jgi:hypothetical protein
MLGVHRFAARAHILVETNLGQMSKCELASLLTLRLKNAASICGLSFSKFELGGMTPLSRARTVLTILARPLAPSKCPIFDLTAPLGYCQHDVVILRVAKRRKTYT